MTFKKYAAASLLGLISAISLVPAIADQKPGVFISYDSGTSNSWGKSEDAIFKKLGCKFQRKGSLNKGATLGNLTWNTANHFKVLACKEPVLHKLVESGSFDKLNEAVANLRVVEGKLDKISNKKPPKSANYIIKVSHFNHVFPMMREKQLKEINQAAQMKKNGYIEEMVLHPVSAKGITPPDRMTFLYYKSEADGEAFRQNNVDILREIQEFNQKHITDFVYVIGSNIR